MQLLQTPAASEPSAGFVLVGIGCHEMEALLGR